MGANLRAGKVRPGRIIYGALLVLGGVAAVLMPLMATFAAGALFGVLLLVAGLTGVGAFVVDPKAKGSGWSLVWSLIAVVAGVCAIWHPLMGALSITLVVGLALLAQGISTVFHAFAHRAEPGRGWIWMALGGTLTAVFGFWLFAMFPHASLMVPGLFLAFSLVSHGAMQISAGLAPGGPAAS